MAAPAYSRFDFTQWGTGLDSQGLPRDMNKVYDFYKQVAANPSTPYNQGILNGLKAYAKNNPGSASDPMWVTNALDWYWRDIQRKSQKAPTMFGPLDSILKPAITLAASAINPALGVAVGGGLGAANGGGVMGGLLGAAGGYAGGSALNSIASGGLANFGKELLSSPLQTLGGAATKLLGGGGGSGGSGIGSTLLQAAPQLVGAGLSYASGGGNDAYDAQLLAARNAEAQRQATRAQGANQVASTFANQDDYYRRLRSSIFDYQKAGLDENLDDQSRELKFELARRGHLGGSSEVDALGDLQRLYSQGTLRAGSLADDAVARARSADQAAKAGAIRDISLDVDANQAIGNAVSQSQLAAQQAADAAKGEDIGQVFNSLGYLYQQGQAKKGAQRAAATVAGWGRGGSGVGPASSYGGTNYARA